MNNPTFTTKAKEILAKYEIGFVTHGKDVDQHLANFLSALSLLHEEEIAKARIGTAMECSSLLDDLQGDGNLDYTQATKLFDQFINELKKPITQLSSPKEKEQP